VSYKDLKSFHKEISDGGRKARAQIRAQVERKEQKYAHKIKDSINTDETIDQWECKGCGYIGDELSDFAKTNDEGDISGYMCPSCGSDQCGPMKEEDYDVV